jgi:membrane fusion protein (multidrug efflux system)
MTEQSDKPGSINAQPTANGDASAFHDAKSAQTPPESRAAPQEIRKPTQRRKFLVGVLGVAVLVVLLVFGIPWVEAMLNTVSTDDAFVNGHVTFVAPRVAGQIARVLVDDNNRVHKGDLLAELDKEPYRVAVSEKQAAVDTAKADLMAAIAAAPRDRSAGNESTLEPATRRGGCRQPGRSPARAGRCCLQEQGRTGVGAA